MTNCVVPTHVGMFRWGLPWLRRGSFARPAGERLLMRYALRPETAALAAVADEACGAIEKVHAGGVLPVLKMDGETGGALGVLEVMGLHASRLGLKVDGQWPHLSAVHETGHLVDKHLLGDGQWISMTPAVAAWRDAVHKSRAFKALLKGRKKMWAGAWEYWSSDTELFARSYAQWITVRSGDAVLATDLKNALRSPRPGVFWKGKDFDKIAVALDDLFRERGLLK